MQTQLSVLETMIATMKDNLAREKAQMEKIRERVTQYAAKLEALQEYHSRIASGRLQGRLDTPAEETVAYRPKASEAVIQLLRQHPDGLTRTEIITALATTMDSTAKNPRHIIRTTLYNLKRSHRVHYNDDTGLYRIPGLTEEDEEKKPNNP